MTRSAHWTALGTRAGLVVSDPRALPAARLAVEAELEAIDLACSRFRADSDLSCLNARAGRPVCVSALLLEAVGVALRAAALTDGIVDPTIGRALILAGYDRDFALIGDPPPRLAATRVPGWRAVSVDPTGRTVRIPRGVRLDLGATARRPAGRSAGR